MCYSFRVEHNRVQTEACSVTALSQQGIAVSQSLRKHYLRVSPAQKRRSLPLT